MFEQVNKDEWYYVSMVYDSANISLYVTRRANFLTCAVSSTASYCLPEDVKPQTGDVYPTPPPPLPPLPPPPPPLPLPPPPLLFLFLLLLLLRLPTKFRFDVGPVRRNPLLVQCRTNGPRHWPNTKPSLGLLYILRKHLAFTQCTFNVDPLLRRWPDIGTAWGDCTVFSDCCMRVTMRVKLSILATKTPDNMHWPNADVMLGQHYLNTF